MVALDSPAKESNLLITTGIDRKINETALNLCPLLAHLARKPVGVLIESLMENSYENKAPTAARGELGKLLEKVDIGDISRRALQKLSHFINNNQQTA